MNAARLSPAASLLRNSKLFAIPPAVALPPPAPSSEPVPRSDTATTIYPTRAAIETPLISLGSGDWGLKRSLPLKSTTKSGSPSVRLNKGIDTREHIADFDSAADHVLTLKKFQELNQSIQHPRSYNARGSKVHLGVFRHDHDNILNTSQSSPSQLQYSGVWPSLSPEKLKQNLPEALKTQEADTSGGESRATAGAFQGAALTQQSRRWRFDGPSLAQMSGLEFDKWIQTIDASKQQEFREIVKTDLLSKMRNAHIAKAQDEGTVGEVDSATLQVSEEEISDHFKRLRQQPRIFGRLIADFLDLPQGPSGQMLRLNVNDVWEYGREKASAATTYEETGPPKMHPSAGLSYIHSDKWAQNHAIFGPQDKKQPVVARQVKIRYARGQNVATNGVAGFIVEREAYKGTMAQTQAAYTPQSGGQKTVVRPDRAEMNERGGLKLTVIPANEYLVEGTKAIHNSMVSDAKVAALRPNKASGSRVMQPLTKAKADPLTYKKRDDLNEADLDFLGKMR